MSPHNAKFVLMTKRKEGYIHIRISEQEKEKIKLQAKKNGFDTVSAYMLWLSRKSSK
jgi:predicted DNA binding CopG/RHH family protein